MTSEDEAEGRRRFAARMHELLDADGDDLGPATRAYLAEGFDRLADSGSVTFDAATLQEALVEDSPDVARIDRARSKRRPDDEPAGPPPRPDGSRLITGAWDPEDRP